MIERLAREASKRPLLALAVTGVVGAVVLARLRSGEDRPSGTREHVARLANTLGGQAADALARGADLLERGADRGADALERGADLLGKGSGIGAGALERGAELLDDGRERAHELVPARFRRSRTDALRDAAASFGITEKTVATFATTFLVRALASYLVARPRTDSHSSAAPASAGDDDAAELEERPVTELRRLASERQIEGRSSMNKEALVEALVEVLGGGEPR